MTNCPLRKAACTNASSCERPPPKAPTCTPLFGSTPVRSLMRCRDASFQGLKRKETRGFVFVKYWSTLGPLDNYRNLPCRNLKYRSLHGGSGNPCDSAVRISAFRTVGDGKAYLQLTRRYTIGAVTELVPALCCKPNSSICTVAQAES